jgi:DNA modification methylase
MHRKYYVPEILCIGNIMSEPSKYISFDDAVEITGLSPARVRKLIRDSLIHTNGDKRRPMVLWDDARALAKSQVPPWSLLTRDMMDNLIDPSDLLVHEPTLSSTSVNAEVNRLFTGNCIDFMGTLPGNFVQTVVTSPPYWGLRRYPGVQDVKWSDGTVCAYGAEETVQDYIRHSMEILRHIKRILRKDGVIWWNVGDIYHTRAYIRSGSSARLDAFEGRLQEPWKDNPNKRTSHGHDYLKDKDLTLFPFHIAIGAQHLGLWVRSVIIWEKGNVIPESAKDRPTTSHEYILMMVKSEEYLYNYDESKEAIALEEGSLLTDNPQLRNLRTIWRFAQEHADTNNNIADGSTIWKFRTVNTEQGKHIAAFPEELPQRCISISSKPGDLVFDPFAGSGTTLAVAKRLSRKYLGCEASKDYATGARKRLSETTSGNRYPTDLRDFQWLAIEPLFAEYRQNNNKLKAPIRKVVNAILYQLSTDCKWHALPKDFVSGQSVSVHYDRWVSSGIWAQVIDVLVHLPPPPSPSSAILSELSDSKSNITHTGSNGKLETTSSDLILLKTNGHRQHDFSEFIPDLDQG